MTLLQPGWLGFDGEPPQDYVSGIGDLKAAFLQKEFEGCLSACLRFYPTASADDRALLLSVALQSLYELGRRDLAAGLLGKVYEDISKVPLVLVPVQARLLLAYGRRGEAKELCLTHIKAAGTRPTTSGLDVLEVYILDVLCGQDVGRIPEPAEVDEARGVLGANDISYLSVDIKRVDWLRSELDRLKGLGELREREKEERAAREAAAAEENKSRKAHQPEPPAVVADRQDTPVKSREAPPRKPPLTLIERLGAVLMQSGRKFVEGEAVGIRDILLALLAVTLLLTLFMRRSSRTIRL